MKGNILYILAMTAISLYMFMLYSEQRASVAFVGGIVVAAVVTFCLRKDREYWK